MLRSPEEVAEYHARGYWGEVTIAQCVRHWREERPQGLAFASDTSRITWEDYDRLSDSLAVRLLGEGLEPGDRLATLLPDGPESHLAWLGADKAGLISLGIGSRAGPQEVRFLVEKSGARALLTAGGAVLPGMADLPVRFLVLEPFGEMRGGEPGVDVAPKPAPARSVGASDLWMINSTSGTTGQPKLVTHTQNRWMYFHRLAVDAGELSGEDVFCSAIPAPFGFGLWTAHFTPTVLGATTHVLNRFDAAQLIDVLSAERVSVLAAVTTQLIMLMNSPRFAEVDLSGLRVVFTGGEAVPYEQAAAFEDRAGCRLLQFYGSNETGAASCTTLRDDRHHRLGTAGRIIPEMRVRLFDPVTGEAVTGEPVTVESATGTGQPGCRGPANCEGYYQDADADRELYTDDGWMLMGDLVNIDPDGYLRVVGRTSDIIIRGGKNISAAAVEAEAMTHPAIALAAAVAVPDTVFGERVCLYVQPRPGETVGLADVRLHLANRGVTTEWFPEYLVEMAELPRSSGGKVAKAELRSDARRRLDHGDLGRRPGPERPIERSSGPGRSSGSVADHKGVG